MKATYKQEVFLTSSQCPFEVGKFYRIKSLAGLFYCVQHTISGYSLMLLSFEDNRVYSSLRFTYYLRHNVPNSEVTIIP